MKKILKTAGSILSWILLIFAFMITLLVFSSDRNNGIPSVFGYMPFTVETGSMEPAFSAGDLIISKQINDISELHTDDVITFWTIIDSKRAKNTHRITEIRTVNDTYCFVTRGDANSCEDELSVYASDIIGKWTNVRIKGFGKVMSFLRTKTGFFIFIVIPMVIFFLFELYKFIMVVTDIRRPVAEIDEEEIKRRAIEEYLAEQKQKEDTSPENSDRQQ